jgi:transcriptional regulator GlxA family with amidase domain
MPRHRPTEVQLLVLHDCTALVPVGLFDLLRKSSELADALPGARSRGRLQLTLISAGKTQTVRAAGGVRLHCDATLAECAPGDVVVVPALDPDVFTSLGKNAAIVPWLQAAYRRGSDVASACTGAFALAAAGLLDGRTATTHWAFQSLLAERHPRVRLVPQAILVDQGRIVTAGGATSFVNLAHFLVERLLGPEIARAASQMFLIDPNKAPQGAYAVFSSQKLHGDEPIVRAQARIEGDPAAAVSIDDLARSVALSRRTFARRFRSATGNTPLEYVQRVRVEAAKRALEAGKSVADVAARVGYGDPVAFRKVFARLTGLTPADYRSRYGPRRALGEVH